MFKKPTIRHQPDADHLISRVNQRHFKKGVTVEIPSGYELVCVDASGASEVIKNVLTHKLPEAVELLFFVKNNRRVIRSNWGTPNRLNVTTTKGDHTLGGYGHVEFQLINPVRFIMTRMTEDLTLTEQALTKLVLGHVTTMLRNVLPPMEPLDVTQETTLIKQLSQAMEKEFARVLDDFGIASKSLVIENLNVKPLEEEA